MKHYYDDDGNLQHDQNRELLVKLAEALNINDLCSERGRRKQRHDVFSYAGELIYDYDIHRSMAGIGGCLSLDEWKDKQEDTPIKTVLKQMLYQYVADGFIHQEFILAAHAAICEIQMSFALGA